MFLAPPPAPQFEFPKQKLIFKINGLVGNANLIDETTLDDIYNGYEFVENLSRESGLPLEFITVASELMSGVDVKKIQCPILRIERQLVPPWQKAAGLGPAGSPRQRQMTES